MSETRIPKLPWMRRPSVFALLLPLSFGAGALVEHRVKRQVVYVEVPSGECRDEFLYGKNQYHCSHPQQTMTAAGGAIICLCPRGHGK